MYPSLGRLVLTRDASVQRVQQIGVREIPRGGGRIDRPAERGVAGTTADLDGIGGIRGGLQVDREHSARPVLSNELPEILQDAHLLG